MPGKCHSGFHWKVKSATDYQAHPSPHGPWSLILPGCVRWPRCCPLFNAAGMLVHFDCGTVQHKGCLIDYILPDQICQYVLPYACLCPCTKSTVHTLPGAKPFGQIPPGNTCIQPVYHCIEHFTVVFAWTASLRLSFWWKQVFHSFPLSFTQFMSFHVLKFTTLTFCTQASGFKTGSREIAAVCRPFLFAIWLSLPSPHGSDRCANTGKRTSPNTPDLQILHVYTRVKIWRITICALTLWNVELEFGI